MTHQDYLLETLVLADTRRGFCAPNPAVGAVVVRNNTVIGKGSHFAAGSPHAEVIALQEAGAHARGAVLYVSLEPCAHYGKTPPCVNAIIEAGIKHVFFAYKDPNPLVQGKGQELLEAAGVRCEHMAMEAIDDFYRSYAHWQMHHRPWVTAKLAMSLDGHYALPHQRVLLTNEATNDFTHGLRKKSDAILTTINTIMADNPQLNVRIGNEIISKNIYILDRGLKIPLDARIWKTARSITLLHGADIAADKKIHCEKKGVRCIALPEKGDGLLDLNAALTIIGSDGVHDLWVESGARCFHSLLKETLLNELYLYISPQALGHNGRPVFTEACVLQQYFKTMQVDTKTGDMITRFW